MVIKFPYEVFRKKDGAEDSHPMVDCWHRAQGSWMPVSAFVDAGSDISVMNRALAEQLELDLLTGSPVVIEGVSGSEIPAYVHKINLRVGSKEFSCRIAFADRDDVPPLIGREDFSKQFVVSYDEIKQVLLLHPRDGN
jgi:hypothetical protein